MKMVLSETGSALKADSCKIAIAWHWITATSASLLISLLIMCIITLKKGEFLMAKKKLKNRKTDIMAQTAELSRLLGMIPSDSNIDFIDHATGNKMGLSNWLGATRDSFLKLSLSVSRALDINLQ